MPAIAPYIVALSALILVGLFALQSQGTDRICATEDLSRRSAPFKLAILI